VKPFTEAERKQMLTGPIHITHQRPVTIWRFVHGSAGELRELGQVMLPLRVERVMSPGFCTSELSWSFPLVTSFGGKDWVVAEVIKGGPPPEIQVATYEVHLVLTDPAPVVECCEHCGHRVPLNDFR